MLKLQAKRGFSLIEIIVVLIIIGVLGGLVYPTYTNTIERTRTGEALEILGSMRRAQEAYSLEFGTYATNPALLDVTMTTPTYFDAPTIGGTASAPFLLINRTGDGYRLNMTIAGTVTCTGVDCTRIGY